MASSLPPLGKRIAFVSAKSDPIATNWIRPTNIALNFVPDLSLQLVGNRVRRPDLRKTLIRCAWRNAKLTILIGVAEGVNAILFRFVIRRSECSFRFEEFIHSDLKLGITQRKSLISRNISL